jgi:transposase InsO family protein
VIELYSRKVIGWSMGNNIDTELAIRALKMSLRDRPFKSLVLHSDRGSQYNCRTYLQVLEQHEITASMSRKGNCWDKAVAESFFASIKVELKPERVWRREPKLAPPSSTISRPGTIQSANTRRTAISARWRSKRPALSLNYPSTKSGQVQDDTRYVLLPQLPAGGATIVSIPSLTNAGSFVSCNGVDTAFPDCGVAASMLNARL